MITNARIARDRWVSLGVFVGLVALWRILPIVLTADAAPGEPMIAGWQAPFTKTSASMSDYWAGGPGVPSVAEGAPRSYLAATLWLADHWLQTLVRPTLGLLAGRWVGVALGIAVSLSRWTRPLVDMPVQFLGTLPLLAMAPPFQIGFGTNFIGEALFVAHGFGVIVFAGTVNAVRDVPSIYVDNAHALGAERIGAQSGLGYVIVHARQFAYLDRMFLFAPPFVIDTSPGYWAVSRLAARQLEWAPASRLGGGDVLARSYRPCRIGLA